MKSAVSCASVVTFAALTAAACDSMPVRSASDPGATIVLEAAEVRVAGASDTIAEIVDFDVLADGTVWVLNSVEPFFIAFGRNGDLIQAHGRRGGGPGEFQAPAGFVRGGIDGEPWVFDRERSALIQVSGSETEHMEIRLPEAAFPRGSVAGGIGMALASNSLIRVRRLGDEIILPRRVDASEGSIFSYWQSAWSSDLVALRPEAAATRRVISLADVFGDPSPHVDLSGTHLPFPLWYRLWDLCGNGGIRVYDRIDHVVRGFASDGIESAPTPLPPPRYTELSGRNFARATIDIAAIEMMGRAGDPELTSDDSARFITSIMSRLTADPAQLASLLPRYTDLRCDEDGALWLQPFDPDSGALRGGPVWLRIARDGDTREVRFPDRFAPHLFASDRIWGVQRDEYDVASVAWITMPDRF